MFLNSADSWDCTKGSCGSFSWWVALNSTAQSYVYFGSASPSKCTDGTYISTSTLTPLICQCPTYASAIAPCTCGVTEGSTETLTLACANQNKTDNDIANFISLVAPNAPVDTIDFSVNSLTKVPKGLPTLFPKLANVKLSNNSITAIQTGDLNLTSAVAVKVLDFSYNKITVVQVNSLPGLLLF